MTPMEMVTCKCGARVLHEKAVIDVHGDWRCEQCRAKKEIIILCNSAECVAEVSNGYWPDLHTRNLFTCNNAHTYFRTAGRHLNMFSDVATIAEFMARKNKMPWQYNKIEFVFNVWDFDEKGVHCPDLTNYGNYKISPVKIGCTSAIGALFYLNAVEDFDTIHLVGYTRKEWEGKYRKEKQEMFDKVAEKYEMVTPRSCVYAFSQKPMWW